MGTGSQRRGWAAIAAGIVAALGVAAVDVATGYEINLGLFYLVPIALVTWGAGLTAGLALGVACVAGMFFVDHYVTRDIPFPSNNLVPYWNAAIRLGYFAVFATILSKLRKAHEREKDYARRDFLTGIANSQGFVERAAFAVAHARSTGRPFSVAYLDCDNFKLVNDRFGHSEGDAVLRETAATAVRHLRSSDTIARLGGDEFAVLLLDADAADARRRMESLNLALLDAVRRRNWPVTFSIGLVTWLDPPDDLEAAMREPDRVMYAVKHRGKDGIAHQVLGE